MLAVGGGGARPAGGAPGGGATPGPVVPLGGDGGVGGGGGGSIWLVATWLVWRGSAVPSVQLSVRTDIPAALAGVAPALAKVTDCIACWKSAAEGAPPAAA